jgi:uncharacterized protein
MAAGPRREAPCRHQHADAGWLAAIVAGPASISPLDWICPLLAIDADAFNHGGTAEFAAISAVVQHHNAISNTLSTNPTWFEPIHLRKPNGDVDARPWCLGFHAAMQPRLSAWAPLLDTSNINHGLLLPILLHCVDDNGHPLLGPTRKGPETKEFLRDAHTSQRSSRPCANTGCRSATHALAEYRIRGSSCRLLSERGRRCCRSRLLPRLAANAGVVVSP